MNAILGRRYSVLLLCLLVGCDTSQHDFAWMPDSSGFLFRKSATVTSDIIHFDLERKAMRSMVVGDATFTCLPGISPDGKQFALSKVNRSPKGSTVQISVYDIGGELRSTSEEFPAGAGSEWDTGIQSSSVHWSVDGLHLVVVSEETIIGVFNLDTKTFRRSPRLMTLFGNQIVVTPDGKGYIARHLPTKKDAELFEGLVFIDWEGWEHAFRLDPTPLELRLGKDEKSKDEKRLSWSRDATKLLLEVGEIRITIDVPARSVSYSEIPGSNPGRGADEMEFRVHFSSAKAGVAVRQPVKQADGSKRDVLSVHLADQGKSREILTDIKPEWFRVSPNDQMVAVAYVKDVTGGTERRIVVVRDNGEVIADILREHIPTPIGKTQQSSSAVTPADTPTISHWKSVRRLMDKYLPIVESPDRIKAREALSSLSQELATIPTKDVDPLLVKLTVDGASLFRDRLAADSYLTSPAFLVSGMIQGAAGDPLGAHREGKALLAKIQQRMTDYTRQVQETVAALSKKHGVDFLKIK